MFNNYRPLVGFNAAANPQPQGMGHLPNVSQMAASIGGMNQGPQQALPAFAQMFANRGPQYGGMAPNPQGMGMRPGGPQFNLPMNPQPAGGPQGLGALGNALMQRRFGMGQGRVR